MGEIRWVIREDGGCIMCMNDMMHHNDGREWAKAKYIFETRGISSLQLHRYAADGLIRTSNILRPGRLRGSRLFNVADVDDLIERSIERLKGFVGQGDDSTGNQ